MRRRLPGRRGRCRRASSGCWRASTARRGRRSSGVTPSRTRHRLVERPGADVDRSRIWSPGSPSGCTDGDVHGVSPSHADRVRRAGQRHGVAEPPAGAGVEVDELRGRARRAPTVAPRPTARAPAGPTPISGRGAGRARRSPGRARQAVAAERAGPDAAAGAEDDVRAAADRVDRDAGPALAGDASGCLGARLARRGSPRSASAPDGDDGGERTGAATAATGAPAAAAPRRPARGRRRRRLGASRRAGGARCRSRSARRRPWRRPSLAPGDAARRRRRRPPRGRGRPPTGSARSGALASARAITSSKPPARRAPRRTARRRLGQVRPQLRLVAVGRERRARR